MNGDEYLSSLILQSQNGWVVGTALPSIVDNLARQVVAQQYGVSTDSIPAYQRTSGQDDLLTSIRNSLLPYWPGPSSFDLRSVPVGVAYNMAQEGFASLSPYGEAAAVCIDLALKTQLRAITDCMHIYDPAYAKSNGLEDKIYVLAATYFMHHYYALKGEVLPPFPPRPRRDPQVVSDNSLCAHLLQMQFIVAHEYSHICLGHIFSDQRTSHAQIVKQHELEADRCAAQTLLRLFRDRQPEKSNESVEAHLGAIGGLFYSAEALTYMGTVGLPAERTYPHPDDRMDQVIETWREHYGEDLRVPNQYVTPVLLIAKIYKLIRSDPIDAIGWFSEMAHACSELGEPYEECFLLVLAREVARVAGEKRIEEKISRHVSRQINQSSDPFYRSLHDFRLRLTW